MSQMLDLDDFPIGTLARTPSGFNDMSQAYLINQQNQGRQTGIQSGSQWLGVSSPSQRYQGTS